MEKKNWKQSTTIQRNAAVAVAMSVAGAALIYGDLFGFSPRTTALIGFASTITVTLGNIWQRFKTENGIE